MQLILVLVGFVAGLLGVARVGALKCYMEKAYSRDLEVRDCSSGNYVCVRHLERTSFTELKASFNCKDKNIVLQDHFGSRASSYVNGCYADKKYPKTSVHCYCDTDECNKSVDNFEVFMETSGAPPKRSIAMVFGLVMTAIGLVF